MYLLFKILIFYEELFRSFQLHLGPVTMFLNWSFFVPLSRLGYSTYLIHIYVIYWRTGILERYMHYSNDWLIYNFIGKLFLLNNKDRLMCVLYEQSCSGDYLKLSSRSYICHLLFFWLDFYFEIRIYWSTSLQSFKYLCFLVTIFFSNGRVLYLVRSIYIHKNKACLIINKNLFFELLLTFDLF